MTKKFIVVLALFSLTIAGSATPALAAKTDPDLQQVWNLTACRTAAELDCVESVAIWLKGKRVVGRQVGVQKTNFRNEFDTPITGGIGEWTFRGLAGTSTLEARLESPKHILWIDPDGKEMRASSLRVYLNGAALASQRKIEVRVRTSWIVPMDVQLHTDDSDWSRSNYRGGHVWRVVGLPSKISGYHGGNWQDKARNGVKADWDLVRWGFLVHHAAPFGGGGYFGDRCAEAGFTVEAHNAPGAGMPLWNESSETLFFNISAATKNRQGRPVVGKFKLWMPTRYVQCMWPGSTLGMAKRLSISVVNHEGVEQVVQSWSLVDTGMFRIEVNGFDYGDTTIRIKPLRITIYCKYPDSRIEELTGIDPQCQPGSEKIG